MRSCQLDDPGLTFYYVLIIVSEEFKNLSIFLDYGHQF